MGPGSVAVGRAAYSPPFSSRFSTTSVTTPILTMTFVTSEHPSPLASQGAL